MEMVEYGKTGIVVSRLCFGTGHLNNVYASPSEGGDLLCAAFHEGVTFWDTAEMYESQLHVGAALKRLRREQVVLQSKSTAKDYDGMRLSLEKSLRETGATYIDIFFLHALSSPEDLAERSGALDALLKAKEEGLVRVVGCSTHIYAGPVMDAVIAHSDLSVILSTANKEGRMLEGGQFDRHLAHLQQAFDRGKGVSIMKVLAAGKIPDSEREAWVQWGFDLDCAHAVNLGISNRDQLRFDVEIARRDATRRRTPQTKAA